MPVYLRILSAAWTRQRHLLRLATIGLLTAWLPACSAVTASPSWGPDPSDPSVRVPLAGYRSTIGGYTSQRPVEPRPWREQNERVAPKPKQ